MPKIKAIFLFLVCNLLAIIILSYMAPHFYRDSKAWGQFNAVDFFSFFILATINPKNFFFNVLIFCAYYFVLYMLPKRTKNTVFHSCIIALVGIAYVFLVLLVHWIRSPQEPLKDSINLANYYLIYPSVCVLMLTIFYPWRKYVKEV